MPDLSSPIDGFTWPEASDDDQRLALDNVREHGAHVICVTGDGPVPQHAFTLGLYARFGHPEVLVLGLPPEVCEDVLGEIIEGVAVGRTFADGDEADDILRSHPMRFVAVPDDARSPWLDLGAWLYGSLADGPPVLQVLWPAKNGRFPGQKGSPTWMKKHQPVLGTARP